MITKIINFCITYRKMIVVLYVFVGLVAIYSLKNATVDAIPDIGENQQIVFTEWPGRSPQDIEEQVTYPLSQALQGVPGVKNVRGTSAFGFSTIYVIFREDVDFYWSRSRILEKLSTVGNILPDNVVPTMGPDATGLGQVFWYTLENTGTSVPLSLGELRSLQDWYVRFRLQAVDGVSEVASVGGFAQEYQIDVDPLKLFAYDVHFSELLQAVKSSNVDVGAEVIDEGDREMVVRGLGFFRSIQDIENVVIKVKNDTPIRVKEVARVQMGPAFRRGALDKNGQEVVGGVVTMRYGANPQKVIDRVKEKIKEITPGLPHGVAIVPFYDRSGLIERTMGTVYSALAQEILITIVVVIVFLLHFRSSILVSLTLPFGVGISFILMYLVGLDSNIMSLSGLVIAIGTMVDMGIIMTENIYSSLAQNPGVSAKERLHLIRQSALEVGPAILTAVATTVITFLPVFALEGAEGKLFVPLAWAKTFALVGAVLVAVTLIPALAFFMLSGELRPIEQNKVSTWIVSRYRPILQWVLENKRRFALAPIALLLLGLLAYGQLGKEFMPMLNEGDLLYMPVTTPDVSISKARELLSYTDQVINSHPQVAYAVGKLGRASTSLDPAPVAMFETVIALIPEEEWPSGKTIHDIKKELDQSLQVPGLVNSWEYPIQTRIGMISTGIKTQVGIKIFGDKLEILEDMAQKIAEVVERVPGAYGVYAEQITGKPYVEIDIDRVGASRYGINVGMVNQIIQTAVGGMPIGQFYKGRERYPIRVRYKKELRNNIEELKKVLVPSPLGPHIPLGQLAEIKVVEGPAMIQSENGLLRSLVLLNVRDRDIIGFVEEAKETVAKAVDLPAGYSVDWAGQYENEVRASRRLALLIPLALFINILILYWAFKSWSQSMLVFTAIPVATAGGLLFLWLGGFNTSVAVWVGFIALFGIAVDDGVVMMTFIREEMARLKPQSIPELRQVILEAGSRRIRPLVMTTTTTIVALIPVLWSSGTGSEVMKPMALPTVGGMAIELVTLFIVPSLYCALEEWRFSRNNHEEVI